MLELSLARSYFTIKVIQQTMNTVLSPGEAKSDKAFEEKFNLLAERWKRDTEAAPTILEVVTHPAYQQIIGLGARALPLIFKSLANDHEHWYWALKAITGEDPVPKKNRGQLEEMRKAWLAWAAAQGYEF